MAARILVIDDNVELAENLQEILELEGHEVMVAASGDAGLEALEHGHYDLVLTDMRMPGMTGLEVLRAVRARHPGTPVCVMTAYARDATLEEAERDGAHLILRKPLDLGALTGYVERVSEPRAALLVVDDDPAMRRNIMEALQELPGVVPYAAGSVAEARRLAGALSMQSAVIDIRLPDGSGLDLGHDLDEGGTCRPVYVTGYPQSAGREEGWLLEKPFSTERLLELVQKALSPNE